MAASTTPIDAPAPSTLHIKALVAATEDGNMDAVALIMLMLEGLFPLWDWAEEYNLHKYYGIAVE